MSGMPWFKLYRDVASSPKLYELEAIVGAAALSHLVKIWCNVAAHRASGDLTGITPTIVERWADWKGKRGALVAALRETGWLDADGAIHGWHERQAAQAKKFEEDAARPKGSRSGPARGPEETPRGTSAEPDREIRSEKIREEEMERGSCAIAPTPAPSPAIDWNRPEPLGRYGEVMPKVVEEVLAFKFEGAILGDRWTKDHGAVLSRERIEREVKAAMVHRLTLEGHRFRTWNWPDGFVSKVDRWLRDEATKELKHQAAQGFAAKAGAHVVVTADDEAAARAKARTRATNARFDGPHPAEVDGPINVAEVMRRARASGGSGAVAAEPAE